MNQFTEATQEQKDSLEKTLTAISDRHDRYNTISESFDKAKKLIKECFYHKKEADHLVKILDRLRFNCFPIDTDKIGYLNEAYLDYHKVAFETMNDISTKLLTITRGDNETPEEDIAVKHQVMMILYRSKKIDRKIHREVPLSLLTPGTKVKYMISPDHFSKPDNGIVTIKRVVPNGVRSFLIICEEMEPSIFDEKELENKRFNLSYVRGIAEYVPGVADIAKSNEITGLMKRRDVPKKRYNYKVKQIKATPIDRKESWKYYETPNFSSFYNYSQEKLLTRRSKHYVVDSVGKLLNYLVSEIDNHWDTESINQSDLLRDLFRQGVFTAKHYGAWSQSVITANRKRLKKAIKQLMNRHRVPLKQRLLDEAIEMEAEYKRNMDDLEDIH